MLTTIRPEVIKACQELAEELMYPLRPILSPYLPDRKLEALENILFNMCLAEFRLHNDKLIATRNSEAMIAEFCRGIRDSMDIHPYKKSREDQVEEVVEKVLTTATITFPL